MFEQLGVFSSQVFQESPRDKIWKRKHCNNAYTWFFKFVSPLLKVIIHALCLEWILFTIIIAAPIYDMEKHCNIEIAAQISRVSSPKNGIFFRFYSVP